MRQIKQKPGNKGDCGISCIAMVTGNSYKSIKKKFITCKLINRNGESFTTHKDICKVLNIMGKKTERRKFTKWRDFCNDKEIAIVKVNKSMNNYWHWVVTGHDKKGQFILDPNPNKVGKIRKFRGLNGSGQMIVCSIGQGRCVN